VRAVVVVGAGGHAKVCIELLRAAGEEIAWCIGGDDAVGDCLGVPVLGGDQHLSQLRGRGFERAFVAIGDNTARRRLGDELQALGYELVNAVSPSAVVSPSARLGVGVAVMAGVVINADAEIEDLAIVNTAATIDHDCRVGVAAHVAPQCGLAGNVEVGVCTFVGVGSSVIPGVHIGDHVMVGAGAVVISDVDDGATVVGVPARALDRQGR